LGEEKNMFSNWLNILLGGAFALGFGGFGLVMLLIKFSARMRTATSQNWPSVEGRIDVSHVNRMTTSGRSLMTSYVPEVKYTYSVMGHDYQSSHVGFGVPISGLESSAKQAVARYPIGSTRTVFTTHRILRRLC
jgi:hypothetical protein